MFHDRQVQYPGRVKITDPSTDEYIIRDIERAEGDIEDEGTTLDQDGIEEALESYFDVGQENADLIAAELINTGISIRSTVTGSVKYGKIGDLIIVYVKLVVSSALTSGATIASGVPAAYRPAADKLQGIRRNDREKLKLDSGGTITVDNDFTVGSQLFCEFAWYV